ncbi:hypothetical protein Pelo_8642 [Pelomyxa schiedti]|nr:hypothetical protein Pelo_8642 [Pelomyxa schiedti]
MPPSALGVSGLVCDSANTQANCAQGALARLETGDSEAESSLTKFGNQHMTVKLITFQCQKSFLRDWPILDQACGVGDIEVVKWIVLNFGFQEPWQFLDPIWSALSKGHLEVAQWLADYLNWAFERFPRIKPTEDTTDYFYEALAGNSLELAAWIKESFPIEHFELSNFYFVTTKAFWCVMDTFGTALSEEMLDMVCMHIGDVDLVKWFVEESSISPRAETLYSACVRFLQFNEVFESQQQLK